MMKTNNKFTEAKKFYLTYGYIISCALSGRFMLFLNYDKNTIVFWDRESGRTEFIKRNGEWQENEQEFGTRPVFDFKDECIDHQTLERVYQFLVTIKRERDGTNN